MVRYENAVEGDSCYAMGEQDQFWYVSNIRSCLVHTPCDKQT